jgi:hypothetical protein
MDVIHLHGAGTALDCTGEQPQDKSWLAILTVHHLLFATYFMRAEYTGFNYF